MIPSAESETFFAFNSGSYFGFFGLNKIKMKMKQHVAFGALFPNHLVKTRLAVTFQHPRNFSKIQPVLLTFSSFLLMSGILGK